MSATNELTEEALRSLAETTADEETVLSVYVDLDPARFATPPARASQIDSLLDGAHREIESGERSHAARQALRATLQRARELLAPDGEWAKDARAYALFLCEPLGLERGLRLPHPLAGAAVVSDAPFIAPLAEEGAAGRVCVALVDERFARVLRGSSEQLREVVSFGDDVHGRHDQGGWSQARYQRSRHEQIEAHLRHVARQLHELLAVAPYRRLLIACTQPLWPRVVERLSADVRPLLHDERVQLDVGDACVEDVLAAVRPLLEAEERAREDAVLAELQAHLAREDDTRAAAGREAVDAALVERRVETLLYDAALGEDVVEDAVRAAVEQSAEILVLRDRPELGPLGGIAATLRF